MLISLSWKKVRQNKINLLIKEVTQLEDQNKPIRKINMSFEDNLETSKSQEFMEKFKYYIATELEPKLIRKINDEITFKEVEQKVAEILDRVVEEIGYEITPRW